MSDMQLQTILEAFNAPLTEEQAWALCYQCTQKMLKDRTDQLENVSSAKSTLRYSYDKGETVDEVLIARSVVIGSDGTILTLGNYCSIG